MYKYHEPIFNIYTEAFRSKIMEKYSQQKHFTGKIHITKGAFRMSTIFFLKNNWYQLTRNFVYLHALFGGGNGGNSPSGF